MGGLDGVDVLHGELDGAVDDELLRESLVRIRGRHEVHVDLVDVRVDRLRPVHVRDVVAPVPNLDRQVREQPELVVAPRRNLSLVEEAGQRSEVGNIVGSEQPGAEQPVHPPLVLGRGPGRARFARREHRRPGHRREHVGAEEVVVVRVDRRHHLLRLRQVGVDELPVHVRRVVPLAHGVDRELPVAVDLRREPVALRHPLQRIRLELEDAITEEGAQRHGVLREVDEDEPGEHVAVHLRHPQGALVEVEELLFLGDVGDAPIEPVAPPVILARELAARAAGLLLRVLLPNDLVAAMGAHVVERVHGAVEIACDDDRRQSARQVAGEVRPRSRQSFRAADAQPCPLEHRFSLGLEELLVDAVVVVDGGSPELGVERRELPLAGGKAFLDVGHGVRPPCVSFTATTAPGPTADRAAPSRRRTGRTPAARKSRERARGPARSGMPA